MIAQPKSFRCVIHLQKVKPDPHVPGKFLLSGEIISAEDKAAGNSFFESGRVISGYTFHLPAEAGEGQKVNADVEFMGDPFVQNYHLRNIELLT